ncbi:bacterio-opsin activator domain-containing protein [Halocatena halophila]
MAIVVEILLADRSFPLVGLAQAIPSPEIEIANTVRLKDRQYLFTITVDADAQSAFEQAVDSQPAVNDSTRIGRTADRLFYQVTVNGQSALFDSHDPSEFEGALIEAAVTPDGLRELKVFSNYDAFSTFRDRCDVYDIPLELLNIASDPENPSERARFGLTDRQYRALSLALTGGITIPHGNCRPRSLRTNSKSGSFVCQALKVIPRRWQYLLVHSAPISPVKSRSSRTF